MATDSKTPRVERPRAGVNYNSELSKWLAIYKNPKTPEELRFQAKGKLEEINQSQLSYYNHLYGTYLKGFFRYGPETITKEECQAIVRQQFMEVLDGYAFSFISGEEPLNLEDPDEVQAKSTDITRTFRHQMYMVVRLGVMRAIERANGIHNQDHVQLLNRFSQEKLDLYESPMEQLVEIVKDPSKKKSEKKRTFKDPIGVIYALRRQLSPGKYSYIEEILEKELPNVNVDIEKLSQRLSDYIQAGDFSAYGLKERDRENLSLLYKYYLTATENVKITQLAYLTPDGVPKAIPYNSKKVSCLKQMLIALAREE